MSTAEGVFSICIDAGIVLEAMMLAARSFGLGVVPISGICNNAAGVAKLLNLPPLVVPIVGTCIGHVDRRASVKPRLPLSTFAHEGRYNDEGLVSKIKDYDEVLVKFWETVGRKDAKSYSESMASFMRSDYYPSLKRDYEAQGYSWGV
eukprot:Blabericola_migrator_1__3220@NODE_1948_length_3518_cov_491_752246_g72_i2_p3_GENE_NODE_1948_length_3518_cov_491_752246_g72_i2NODE_1948_length_3518_cov_491_752246_g72_i2_p3_ORF_typecomplete_len148_score21_89Nitroreductase/PF00881_24/1_8e10TM1586_NiRdase/PF14512_6/5_7e05_NODE_1948_length_3518_cov_491_752246_g72_i29881431